MFKKSLLILSLLAAQNVNSQMPVPMAAGLAGAVVGAIGAIGLKSEIKRMENEAPGYEETAKTDRAEKLKAKKNGLRLMTAITATSAFLFTNQILTKVLSDKISSDAIHFAKYPLFLLLSKLSMDYVGA